VTRTRVLAFREVFRSKAPYEKSVGSIEPWFKRRSTVDDAIVVDDQNVTRFETNGSAVTVINIYNLVYEFVRVGRDAIHEVLVKNETTVSV
jgi:hypothetical protein